MVVSDISTGCLMTTDCTLDIVSLPVQSACVISLLLCVARFHEVPHACPQYKIKQIHLRSGVTRLSYRSPMTAFTPSPSMPWQPSPSLDGIVFQLDDLQAFKNLQAQGLAQGQNQQVRQLATIQSTAEKRVSGRLRISRQDAPSLVAPGIAGVSFEVPASQ